ncbi:SAM-dependent methyltransferase [Leptospira vanthielii]|uniref:Cyclopropane-fatty-acyl-phospholipid synthase n=1 Tax=Leptospira vanthielii serovar Holland str. Waz Holland = ATCC 700522 TaxID=1218591 RepID=N1WBN1_9LEPT|nr:class I SAM-dependent methyltransferase [Leptospira vanthielii]EMY69286.1 cyclopropane-fatty-acyl-phospholipid synthase [Leptospira vanthielii serovar Holland str. Waz Holland = ATCC 700522]
MTPFPFSKSPASILPQSPPYYVSNFGYWDGESSYQTAGLRFVSEFAKGCQLAPQTKILEVGSGLGGSLVYWKKKFHPKLLSAINLPGEQSDFAQQLFASNHVVVEPFLKGSWEVMESLPNVSYDYVFSLDASYHFQNLPAFYKESYRVLKPGGRIVFTHFQVKENKFKNYWWLYLPFLIPKGNLKQTEETVFDLEGVGFKKIQTLDWTKPVLQGFTNESKNLPSSLKTFAKILDLFVNHLGLTYHYYVFEK